MIRALLPTVLWLLCGCDVARPAGSTAPLHFDPRTGQWDTAAASIEPGDEWIVDGHLFQATPAGELDRGAVDLTDLADADVVIVGHPPPMRELAPTTWVRVLGDGGGHRRFADVEAGARFTWLGRVLETRQADGAFEYRETGTLVAEVSGVSSRPTRELVTVELEDDDGTVELITTTPDHPFYVPDLDAYVDIADIEPGLELQSLDGSNLTLRGTSTRFTNEQVYNLQVEGIGNYFVGADEAVLVHNGCPKCRCSARDIYTSGGVSCLVLRTTGVCPDRYYGFGSTQAACQASARALAKPECRGCLGHCQAGGGK